MPHRSASPAPDTSPQVSTGHTVYDAGGLFAVGGGLWMTFEQIKLVSFRVAPPWSVVPPLFFSVAAIWNARTNARRARETPKP